MTIDFTELNSNQRFAVEWDQGPILVLAGPGSGKTKVLTSRVSRLLNGSADSYWRVLALTFTTKAATEMRDRVKTQVPNSEFRAKLTTFHSFAVDLLRQHGSHIGIQPNFTIITDDSDRRSLMNEALARVDTYDISFSVENLLPLIDRFMERNGNSGPGIDSLHNQHEEGDVVEQIYKEYRSILLERNLIDFPSLLVESLSLLRNVTGVRKQMHRAYRYICVDEFQDTNLSQYNLLYELVNPETRNLFIVADDDQIIYQWNGASSERLKQVKNDFEMMVVNLPENYRCPPNVVKIANRLIAVNTRRLEEKRDTQAYKVSERNLKVVGVHRFSSFSDEASWVSRSIANRPIGERRKCVVLARTKKLLDEVIEQLNRVSLVGFSGTRKNEFLSPQLKWLHSLLRLANARSSSVNLYKVCKSFCELAGVDVDPNEIVLEGNSGDVDYLREWANTVLKNDLSSISEDMIKKAVLHFLADRLNHGEFLTKAFQWLDRSSETGFRVNNWYDEYASEKETWNSLMNDIYNHYGTRDISLYQMLQELDLRSKAPKPPREAIPCMTIHASKGMEFDHVYLIGMVEDQLPSWMSIKKGKNSPEMEEERRSCFVAITRAQESLHLTFSDKVNNWRKEPSRFLSEMGVLDEAVRPSDCEVGIQGQVMYENAESYRMAS